MQTKTSLALIAVITGFVGFISASEVSRNKSRQLPADLPSPHGAAKLSLTSHVPGNTNLVPRRIEVPLSSPPEQLGLYRSSPFTCLIVVPEAGLDEHCVVQPAQVDPAMPIMKPELEFSPLR